MANIDRCVANHVTMVLGSSGLITCANLLKAVGWCSRPVSVTLRLEGSGFLPFPAYIGLFVKKINFKKQKNNEINVSKCVVYN